MWYEESVFYQIYPLGMVGAPFENDGAESHRILNLERFIPHFEKLGVGAVYFCPVFESSTHGYDTKDYLKIDTRLGTNEDFKALCNMLHQKGIKVVLDGVFNHVGREFFAFRDVKANRESSPYRHWFYIDFGGNSCYNDGFYYQGWEGHYELVKLNLDNPEVRQYLLNAVSMWMDYFAIDGLRLDVAYMLNRDFMRELKSFCTGKREDFFLVGEMIHGDYNTIVNHEMLHSATNYECYKGLYSSFNSMNMFEIGYSLTRQFGKENWCLYRGKQLLSFIDNHDVTRISTILANKNHLKPVWGMLMTMPGIPSVYYGSEWAIEGDKAKGDGDLRPFVEEPVYNELTEYISRLIKIRNEHPALQKGDFEVLATTNHQLVFQRSCEGERIIVLINASEDAYTAHFNANAGRGVDLLTGENYDFGGGSNMEPYGVRIIAV